tara:strand:- start:2877 stop:3410 length:534 start_codon:yes stop_codon:yes gene_type:complete
MSRSSIDKIAPEIRQQLETKLLEGAMTLDQMVDWLETNGFEISRSALGRHKQKLDKIGAKMRESQQMAEALVQELGPSIANGHQFRMLTQILQTIVFQHMSGSLEEGDGMDPKDIHFLGRALKDLVSATTLEDDRVRKIETETRKEAAERAKTAATSEGLSADTVAAIEKAVLGIEL